MAGISLALIPGDGIGVEVMESAQQILDTIQTTYGVTFATTELDWSCERYHRTGAMMPADGLDVLGRHDAILLGAVGWPGVPDHVSLWGLLIPIRRAFGQYVNLRPMRVFEGVPTPVRPELSAGTDFVVVRENSEGEYSEVGGRIGRGLSEVALQQSSFSRAAVERIASFAMRMAESRRGQVRAPDIAGQGRANPIGMLWSVVLMLDHLRLPEPAAALMAAIEESLRDPRTRTADLGGTASTGEVTDFVAALLAKERVSR